jgi:hypothetical protein
MTLLTVEEAEARGISLDDLPELSLDEAKALARDLAGPGDALRALVRQLLEAGAPPSDVAEFVAALGKGGEITGTEAPRARPPFSSRAGRIRKPEKWQVTTDPAGKRYLGS